jgi:hypothetical protein
VLYLDIDVHHGDGVEEAFYTTGRRLMFFASALVFLFPATLICCCTEMEWRRLSTQQVCPGKGGGRKSRQTALGIAEAAAPNSHTVAKAAATLGHCCPCG